MAELLAYDSSAVDAAGDPRPLVIVGSPRSGTTFLADMVNRFFDVHISRDNGALIRFHGLLRRYEPLRDERNLRRLIADLYRDHFVRTRLRDRGLRLDEEMLFERISPRTYAGVIAAICSAVAETHGKSAWGYKRASFARVAGSQLDALFPRARFVHIIRDARDVVLSMRHTTNGVFEKNWYFAAADWVSHVRAGRKLGYHLRDDRYMEIRYEQLIAEPAETLSQVLRFSGGNAVEARVDRIRRELPGLIRAGNAEKWRRSLAPADLRTVERVAGPLLTQLGYPVVNVEWSGRPVSATHLAWLHADRVIRKVFTRNLERTVRYGVAVVTARLRARLPLRT